MMGGGDLFPNGEVVKMSPEFLIFAVVMVGLVWAICWIIAGFLNPPVMPDDDDEPEIIPLTDADDDAPPPPPPKWGGSRRIRPGTILTPGAGGLNIPPGWTCHCVTTDGPPVYVMLPPGSKPLKHPALETAIRSLVEGGNPVVTAPEGSPGQSIERELAEFEKREAEPVKLEPTILRTEEKLGPPCDATGKPLPDLLDARGSLKRDRERRETMALEHFDRQIEKIVAEATERAVARGDLMLDPYTGQRHNCDCRVGAKPAQDQLPEGVQKLADGIYLISGRQVLCPGNISMTLLAKVKRLLDEDPRPEVDPVRVVDHDDKRNVDLKSSGFNSEAERA